MRYSLAQLTFFLLPVMLGGVSNMVYVKLPWVRRHNAPMDRGWRAWDGKRWLGDHKTWQGFAGMILLTAFWMGVMVAFYRHWDWARRLAVLDYERWFFPWQAWFNGALWGFGYVLFELPNSFVKRRIDIDPGRNAPGFRGLAFLLLDQADSVIGCLVLMLVFFRPTWQETVVLFMLGTGVHYVINLALYAVKLKKQAG